MLFYHIIAILCLFYFYNLMVMAGYNDISPLASNYLLCINFLQHFIQFPQLYKIIMLSNYHKFIHILSILISTYRITLYILYFTYILLSQIFYLILILQSHLLQSLIFRKYLYLFLLLSYFCPNLLNRISHYLIHK